MTFRYVITSGQFLLHYLARVETLVWSTLLYHITIQRLNLTKPINMIQLHIFEELIIHLHVSRLIFIQTHMEYWGYY